MWALLVAFLVAVPVQGAANVTADCDGVTVATSGWPDGTRAELGMEAGPPLALTVNDTWSVAWPLPAAQHSYGVLILGPDGERHFDHGVVDCAVLADGLAPTDTSPVPSPDIPIVARVPRGIWAGVELAPPW